MFVLPRKATVFSRHHQHKIVQTCGVRDFGEVDPVHRVCRLVIMRIEASKEKCHRNPFLGERSMVAASIDTILFIVLKDESNGLVRRLNHRM